MTCGSYSFAIDTKAKEPVDDKPEPPKVSITCRNHPLSAPKHDTNAKGATSVESAMNKWCSDNNEHAVGNDIFWRWGVTELDVPNRNSFWLRASMNGDKKEGKFSKDDCSAAIKAGIEQCDTGKDVNHGFTASVGPLDYSLDLSGVTQDGNPPWKEHPAFPAPEFAPGKKTGGAANRPICYADYGRKLSTTDLESAVNAFCRDGADIIGFGKHWANAFQYPPKGQPQFYASQSSTMHLELFAETVQNGAPEPYDNMDWCK